MFAASANAKLPRFMSQTDKQRNKKTDCFAARLWCSSLCPACGHRHLETGWRSSIGERIANRLRRKSYSCKRFGISFSDQRAVTDEPEHAGTSSSLRPRPEPRSRRSCRSSLSPRTALWNGARVWSPRSSTCELFAEREAVTWVVSSARAPQGQQRTDGAGRATESFQVSLARVIRAVYHCRTLAPVERGCDALAARKVKPLRLLRVVEVRRHVAASPHRSRSRISNV